MPRSFQKNNAKRFIQQSCTHTLFRTHRKKFFLAGEFFFHFAKSTRSTWYIQRRTRYFRKFCSKQNKSVLLLEREEKCIRTIHRITRTVSDLVSQDVPVQARSTSTSTGTSSVTPNFYAQNFSDKETAALCFGCSDMSGGIYAN
jgi:hypothetical protein